MARYSGATWRPISMAYLTGRKINVYNRVNLHVTAGTGSPYAFFNQPGRASSHFFVYKNGKVEQFVDTAYRAEADGEGNDATISIETEGAWPASVADTEPWTAEQVESLAHLYAWAVKTHGIKRKIATSSKTGEASKGLSWHRLGIDGNWPSLPNPAAGRLQRGGGMHYSSSRGKACPGLAKIKQIPKVYARALEILDGKAGTVSKPVPSKPAASKPSAPKPAPAKIKPVMPKKIRKGDRGALVKDWQRVLKANGHDLGKAGVDGVYGVSTEKATKAWQAKRGLTADGIVGPATWTRSALADSDGRLRQGDRGPHVRIWQRITGADVDGVYGAETARKTKGVQRSVGVTADGIVGPGTRSAVLKATA